MIHGFFIFAAVFLAYANTLSNGFVNDDHTLIEYNPAVRPGGALADIVLKNIADDLNEASAFYRPIQILSYRLDYIFWAQTPAGYHLSNLLYHSLAALLLFVFLARVFGGERPAFWSALIWAVHPIHVKVVSYAASRADTLLFIFMLLALISFLRGWRVLWTLIFSLGAFLSKEAAIVLPFLLIFCGWALDIEGPFSKKSFLSSFRRSLPSVILIISCWIFRSLVLKTPIGVISLGAEVPTMFERFLVGIRALFILHGAVLFPFDLRIVRYLNPPHNAAALLLDVSYFLALVILGALSWRLRKNAPILMFGFAWTIVNFAPYLNIIPLNWNISEHWMYLPSVGIISCGIFFCLSWSSKKRWIYASILAGLTLALAITTAARNFQWEDDVTLFEPEVKAEPGSRWARYNLAFGYVQRGMIDEALKHYERALSMGPPMGKAYWTIGRLYIRKNNFAKAVTYYEKAAQLEPQNPLYHASLADAYLLAERYSEAEIEYLKAEALDPNEVTHPTRLGILYVQMEKFGLAAQAFQRALKIDPLDQTARRNLRLLKKFSDKIRSVKEGGSGHVDNT